MTQATVKDLKTKVKEKQNEINVLKEMIKSSSSSLKAKDIDIQRQTKRIQRLEKLVEINNGLNGAQGGRGSRQGAIQEEEFEETQNFGIPNMNHGGFAEGLETQVNQELLQHQMAGMNYRKPVGSKKYPSGGGFQSK